MPYATYWSPHTGSACLEDLELPDTLDSIDIVALPAGLCSHGQMTRPRHHCTPSLRLLVLFATLCLANAISKTVTAFLLSIHKALTVTQPLHMHAW
jgi:hypothetical protein